MPAQKLSSETFQFPEVRVVEASAGSGKTYALAKRYIQLLLNPALRDEEIPIRQILAITFTNKAAFEMKARILEFLKNLAFGKFTPAQEEDILKPIGVTKEEAAKRAFAVMEIIIRHYNFFQVQTIDKFINALLSGCAFKIGLTANFKIKTNSDEYLQYSLDELLDRAAKDKDIRRAFEQFLHNYLYLENRTGWFPKKDMLGIIATLFAQFNTYGMAFREGPFSSEDIVKKKRVIAGLIKELNEKAPEGTDKRFVNAMEKFLKEAKEGFDIDAMSDYFAREEIPLRKGVECSRDLQALWENIRRQLKELCEEEAYSLFNPYINVFDHVLAGIYSKASKDDVLFLSELNKKAGKLFDDDYVTVQEMYYRLATRFRHYLIDEFQDTSKLQWHNLEKMAEEALSTGGSLFYVGDRKQAIYGFRGGEVALFDSLKESFEAFNVQVNYLTKNYRSQRAIVEFNNALFSLDNIRSMIAAKQEHEEKQRNASVVFSDEDIAGIEHIFESAQQTHREENQGGYVKVQYVDIDKKEERDEFIRGEVVATIKELQKRYRPKDIAILARSNIQIEQLTNWLLQENIQVESERTSNVKENVVVKELVQFLTFLNSPIDNLAFAGFLLGETFPQISGLSKEEIQDFLFTLRDGVKKQKDFYIYTEFRKAFPKVWDTYINEFFQNVGLYPLYEMMISIYNRFGLLTHFKQYQGFLMHFLGLIKKQEEDHPDLASFLEYFEELEGEELYINVSERDCVRILTIHKSKGLEFPVVIIPFLGMEIQVGAQGDNQQSYMLLQHDDTMNLVRQKKKYLKFSDHLYRIYRHEYKKAFLSELNNAYVALTRAKNELHLFIPKKVGQSFNVAKFLVPQEMYEHGQPSKVDIKEEAKRETLKLPPADYQDWIGFLKDEFPEYNGLLHRERRLEGEVFHFMFSLVGDLSKVDLEGTLKYLQERVRFSYPHITNPKSYTDTFKKMLVEEKIRPLFYLKEGEVFCEKEIVDERGMTKRVDRLIVTDKNVTIIDYKSSVEETGKQQEQLNEYREILRQIFPKKEIECFIIYLDSGNVERMA